MELVAPGVENLVPAVGYVSGNIVIYDACLEIVIESELPSLGPHLGGIGYRRTVSENSRNGEVHEDVLRPVVEVVERKREPVAQHAEIKSDIAHHGGLPLDSRVCGREAGSRYGIVVEHHSLADGHRLEILVCTDAVISYKTPGTPELE